MRDRTQKRCQHRREGCPQTRHCPYKKHAANATHRSTGTRRPLPPAQLRGKVRGDGQATGHKWACLVCGQGEMVNPAEAVILVGVLTRGVGYFA